ncbi:MAG: ribosomal-processing cysteine protease Prp [Bacillota bacterium]|nr:ribosomal-processing cysteine protease Prp [Bacillota bacterium]
MIKAVFSERGGRVVGFKMSGHSGAAAEGNDIVCAAVSGAVQCVIAVIDEELGFAECLSARELPENVVSCDISSLSGDNAAVAEIVLGGFEKLMEMWEKDFPKNISVKKQFI